MVEVKKEGGVLTILVLQDVLLEKDNTVKVTYDTTQENSVTGITTIACEGLSYPEEYYKIAEEFMSQDQNGVYTFERVLRADIDYCGDTDRKVLALLMEDKYRVIETADSRADRAEYFDCVERAVENMFRYQVVGGMGYTSTVGCIDSKWLSSLSENVLETETGLGELLKKLAVYQAQYPEQEKMTASDGLQIESDITTTKTGINVRLNFCGLETDGIGIDRGRDLFLSSEIRTRDYIATLDDNTMEYLEELGYEEEEIINSYLTSDSVADEGFIDDLMKAEYRELFWTNPDDTK